MGIIVEEKRSHGPLFAFIDLLFLLVAFMVLVLFFMQMEKTTTVEKLEQVQEKLADVVEEKSAFEETLAQLAPLIEQFTVRNLKETEKRRAASAKELRRRSRTTTRLIYQVEKDGSIRYRGTLYSLKRFKNIVVATLRKSHWIAFRAQATPETPFGLVVSHRKAVLENSNEFDTYWDNLVDKQ